jgi:hypothetical protein
MDLGPQWPFWLQLGLAAVSALILSWLSVSHARGSRAWKHGLLGLCFWTVLVGLTWALQEPLCRVGWRLTIEIPGCDWEYHRAPSQPGKLALFILLGGIALVLRLAAPVAWIVFIVRWGIQRFRPPPNQALRQTDL